MCGLILAPWHYPERYVEAAMRKMNYRGAENKQGLESLHGWRLGHVRLAIQDLSDRGHQPFTRSNSAYAFAGEFFDHKRDSEGQYLDELLQSPGLAGFHKADGFWSVIEVARGEATAITDHLGIKPLYWWKDFNIVCSEIFPMFCLEDAPELDEVYLSNCLKFGYDYSGRTPYKGIVQLPPGSVLTLDTDGLVGPSGPFIQGYWDWSKVPGNPDDLRTTIDRALQNRLISDRPVAMLLSGGLDSSIIYYSLLEKGQRVRCFSVENGESEFLPGGVEVLPVQTPDLAEAVRVMQAPLDLGSLLPQIQLAKAVGATGTRVCLTGDGADELFGGYSRAAEYDSQHSDVFCELPYYHLPRLDRVMMRETIELRSPFLAPSVVATALRTPRPGRTMKQALKAAYARTVPPEILSRKKLPLKSPSVLQGGVLHRANLVKEFRNAQSSL